MKITTREINAINQSRRRKKIPKDTGTDNISAVNADNCWGERFLVLNTLQS